MRGSLVSLLALMLTIGASTQAAQYSGWEMSDPIGGNFVYYNEDLNNADLSFASCPLSNGLWVSTPDPEKIAFTDNAGIGAEQIGFISYYKWFQTTIYVPNNEVSHQFRIRAEVDDAVNFYVNSTNIGWQSRDQYNLIDVMIPLHTGDNNITALLLDCYATGFFKESYLYDATTQTQLAYNPLLPEPASLLAIGGGLSLLLLQKRRKK